MLPPLPIFLRFVCVACVGCLPPLLRKDLPDLGHLLRFQVEGLRHLFVELAAGGVVGLDESLQGRHLLQTQAAGPPDLQEALLVGPHLARGEVEGRPDSPCDDRENRQGRKSKASRASFHSIPLFVSG